MYCVNCKKQIPSVSTHCPYCGVSQNANGGIGPGRSPAHGSVPAAGPGRQYGASGRPYDAASGRRPYDVAPGNARNARRAQRATAIKKQAIALPKNRRILVIAIAVIAIAAIIIATTANGNSSGNPQEARRQIGEANGVVYSDEIDVTTEYGFTYKVSFSANPFVVTIDPTGGRPGYVQADIIRNSADMVVTNTTPGKKAPGITLLIKRLEKSAYGGDYYIFDTPIDTSSSENTVLNAQPGTWLGEAYGSMVFEFDEFDVGETKTMWAIETEAGSSGYNWTERSEELPQDDVHGRLGELFRISGYKLEVLGFAESFLYFDQSDVRVAFPELIYSEDEDYDYLMVTDWIFSNTEITTQLFEEWYQELADGDADEYYKLPETLYGLHVDVDWRSRKVEIPVEERVDSDYDKWDDQRIYDSASISPVSYAVLTDKPYLIVDAE